MICRRRRRRRRRRRTAALPTERVRNCRRRPLLLRLLPSRSTVTWNASPPRQQPHSLSSAADVRPAVYRVTTTTRRCYRHPDKTPRGVACGVPTTCDERRRKPQVAWHPCAAAHPPPPPSLPLRTPRARQAHRTARKRPVLPPASPWPAALETPPRPPRRLRSVRERARAHTPPPRRKIRRFPTRERATRRQRHWHLTWLLHRRRRLSLRPEAPRRCA
mmetsp:Transcript_9687/g.24474  ORF Transcript_9687/g.24474 Transcript_9687/m.24474 type:complete len:218 (-) Transcript_9687:1277-1930(-)